MPETQTRTQHPNLSPRAIYDGSDGDATKALYDQLALRGPLGEIAVNLFRACKCSARAKLYRGGIRGKGSYRGMAYDRKQQSMANLCAVLSRHASALGVVWGWKQDPGQPVHCWVLYVEIATGQVSFHTEARGNGPDFPRDWDGQRDVCAGRIIDFATHVLTTQPVQEPATSADDDPVIPFGKHRGQRCSEITINYLDWLIGQDWLRPELKTQIERHLASRPEWQQMDD